MIEHRAICEQCRRAVPAVKVGYGYEHPHVWVIVTIARQKGNPHWTCCDGCADSLVGIPTPCVCASRSEAHPYGVCPVCGKPVPPRLPPYQGCCPERERRWELQRGLKPPSPQAELFVEVPA